MLRRWAAALVTVAVFCCGFLILEAQAATKAKPAVETITGRAAAPPQRSEQGQSKRSTRFKVKRRGDPWEVRIVTADGREQVYRGYRERAAKRNARGSDNGVRVGEERPGMRVSEERPGMRVGEERPGMRVMRLRLPAPP